jgi:uncharacterized protein (DUF885 family)
MSAAQQLDAIAAEAWTTFVAAQPYYAAKAGLPVEKLPRGDLAGAEAAAAAGRRRLVRLETINDAELDRSRLLTKGVLTWMANTEAQDPDVYATAFGVAPYQSSWLGMIPDLFFASLGFDGGRGDELYLSLLADYVALVEAMRERLDYQADRGWRVPGPALATIRVSLAALLESAVVKLKPSAERLATSAPGTRARIDALIEGELRAAFARLIAALGPDYQALAPATVGMGQYPGGHDAYLRTLQRNLTWVAAPEEIHATGLEEVARLVDAMAALRSRAFQFNGDEEEFHQRLRRDPRARAASPAALEATYRRHLARMKEIVPDMFTHGPAAECDVERLAPEYEAGMSFGFYRPPIGEGAKGIYYYSAHGIDTRLQMNAAPLIFHELVPGHHFHIARQGELAHLPEIRRVPIDYQVFNEGWAEYSAGLGEEQGLYEDPYDLYGWLTHQRFVAQRLVVDTGMHALGWSLEKARAFMSANTLEEPAFVEAETLRYSTDLPAQALAYRWGFLKFRDLRARSKRRLGKRFDLRRWHEAILSEGGLPMSVLDKSLSDWEASELRHA